MDALAYHYKVQYDEAVSLAQKGEERASLDILYRLRLKPDHSLYRRTVVNYLLSVIAPLVKDRLVYAEECLDLIDIIRKENDSHDPRLDDIELVVEDIQEELRAETAPAIRSTATGLLSAPAEAASAAVADRTTAESEPAGDTDLEMTEQTSADEKGTQEKKNAQAVFDENDVVFRFTSDSKIATPDPNALFGQDLPKIEGYLRDTWYPPRQQAQAQNNSPPVSSFAAYADRQYDRYPASV